RKVLQPTQQLHQKQQQQIQSPSSPSLVTPEGTPADIETVIRDSLQRDGAEQLKRRFLAAASSRDSSSSVSEAAGRKAAMEELLSCARDTVLPAHAAARAALARGHARLRAKRDNLQRRADEVHKQLDAMRQEGKLVQLADRLDAISSTAESHAARLSAVSRRLGERQLCLTREEQAALGELQSLKSNRLASLSTFMASAQRKCQALAALAAEAEASSSRQQQKQLSSTAQAGSSPSSSSSSCVLSPKQYNGLTGALKDEAGRIEGLVQRAKTLEECLD
ncbi:hypothetical protein BOX15_Mlig024499g7, partial [Macrostomum lignano]